MSRRPKPQPDFFGDTADRRVAGDVELLLDVLEDRRVSWLVRRKDRLGDEPVSLPKSRCQRSPPPDDDVFVVPRWIAADRGWL